MSIPDFDGQAIIQIFSNTTNEYIACYSAAISNGNSFSQPEAISTTLGVLTAIATVCSFAVATYFDNLKSTRQHYAHTISVLVIFEVFQSIYLTGAFNVDWPSVLPAWWSNFAWASGMISITSMQTAIANFVGVTPGRSYISPTSSQYSTDATGLPYAAQGFYWYGYPLQQFLPYSGADYGFAATLARSGAIIQENAFLTGLIWFLIALVIVIGLMVVFKAILELLSLVWLVDRNTMSHFRSRWLTYIRLASLRILSIGFFVLLFLSTFQFVLRIPGKVEAIAAIVFLVTLFGLVGTAIYAYQYQKTRHEHFYEPPQTIDYARPSPRKQPGANGGPKLSRLVGRGRPKPPSTRVKQHGRFRTWRRWVADEPTNSNDLVTVHDDPGFTEKFGWLSARYRSRTWWFFLAWLSYQFLRALILAASYNSPIAQIILCLIIELIAFTGFIILRPFEGQRLNTIVVYLLGISKIISTALSLAFYKPFNLARIPTTVVGVVIIVVQGVLTIVLIVAILTGVVTSWLSLTRNKDHQHPSSLRQRFFHRVTGMEPLPRMREVEKGPPIAPLNQDYRPLTPLSKPRFEFSDSPGFQLGGVRRMSKFNELDDEHSVIRASNGRRTSSQFGLLKGPHITNRLSANSEDLLALQPSRSTNSLPFGARGVYRGTWGSRDFENWEQRELLHRNSRAFSVSDPSTLGADAALMSGPTSRSRARTNSRNSQLDGTSPPPPPEHVQLQTLIREEMDDSQRLVPPSYPYAPYANTSSDRIASVGDRRSVTYEIPKPLPSMRPGVSSFTPPPLKEGPYDRIRRMSSAAYSDDDVPPPPPPHRVWSGQRPNSGGGGKSNASALR